MCWICAVLLLLVFLELHFRLDFSLVKYRPLVIRCCYFDNSLEKESEFCVQQTIAFNSILPDSYKVLRNEETAFDKIYQAYQLWLLKKYVNSELSPVLETYHSLLSWKSRKRWHTNNLSKFFGAEIKERLFLLETMDHFLCFCCDKNHVDHSEVYKLGGSPEQDTLTEVGMVVWKLRLAASIVRNTAGFDNDHEIENAKMALAQLSPHV